MRRKNIISIRLSDEELEALEEGCRALNKSKPEYIRAAISLALGITVPNRITKRRIY